MFARAVFSDVPAVSALMDAFAIRPMPRDISSAEYPKAPATGATFWNVAPIIETLVFALLEACARTSANRPASSAVILKAVNASVTMSETVPKSSPEAAARFIMPGKPPSI